MLLCVVLINKFLEVKLYSMENNIIIRLENKEEWKQVENLTREAFWNK